MKDDKIIRVSSYEELKDTMVKLYFYRDHLFLRHSLLYFYLGVPKMEWVKFVCLLRAFLQDVTVGSWVILYLNDLVREPNDICVQDSCEIGQ